MLPDTLDKDRKQTIQAQMRVELSKTRGTATAGSRAPSPFASREMAGHLDRRDGKVFAHVVVPHCAGQYAEREKNKPYFEEFAKKLHGIVADLLAQKPDGWLVDLRGNGGGNMWPMLAGIGPVVGEGELGSFQAPGGSSSIWFLKGGISPCGEKTSRPFRHEFPARPFRAAICLGWRCCSIAAPPVRERR